MDNDTTGDKYRRITNSMRAHVDISRISRSRYLFRHNNKNKYTYTIIRKASRQLRLFNTIV